MPQRIKRSGKRTLLHDFLGEEISEQLVQDTLRYLRDLRWKKKNQDKIKQRRKDRYQREKAEGKIKNARRKDGIKKTGIKNNDL